MGEAWVRFEFVVKVEYFRVAGGTTLEEFELVEFDEVEVVGGGEGAFLTTFLVLHVGQ